VAVGGVEEEEVREVGEAAGDVPRVRGRDQLDDQRPADWRRKRDRLELESPHTHAVSIRGETKKPGVR